MTNMTREQLHRTLEAKQIRLKTDESYSFRQENTWPLLKFRFPKRAKTTCIWGGRWLKSMNLDALSLFLQPDMRGIRKDDVFMGSAGRTHFTIPRQIILKATFSKLFSKSTKTIRQN